MTIRSDSELANTQQKLREVEHLYEQLSCDTGEAEQVRELSMRSLKRLINQLKEEIARYETRQPTRH